MGRFNGVVGLFYFYDKAITLLQSTNYASPVLPPANAFYTRTFNATGNHLNAAPKSSLSTYGQYNFDVGSGTAFVRGEYFRQSKVNYDASNADIFAQKSYDLINASVGWNSDEGGWGVQLVGKNLAQCVAVLLNVQRTLVNAGFVPNDYQVGQTGKIVAPASNA